MEALKVLKPQMDSKALLALEDLTEQVQIFTRQDQQRVQISWEAALEIYREAGIKGLAFLSQHIMKKFFLSIGSYLSIWLNES